MDLEPKKTAVLNRLPIFPLSDAVLFPGTVIPLHVYEDHCRALIRDALAADKMLGLALIQAPPEKKAHPLIHNVACMGEIIHFEELQNGRYNILVRGQQRVLLVEEIQTSYSYQRFRAQLVPKFSEHAWHSAKRELAWLQSCLVHLQRCVEDNDQELAEVLRATSDPLELIDILSAVLVNDTATQQYILASMDLGDSLRTLNHCLIETMVKYPLPNVN